MISSDEDALICDLAEVYHIYDYKSLSPAQVATFSVGLRENSRIKMKLSGLKYPLETILLAHAVDRLSLLVWSKSKDAESGRNKPNSIADKLLGNNVEQEREYVVFNSPEEFELAMAEINRKGE